MDKIELVKRMHEFMCDANDEEIYGSWIICGVPDGATEQDFIDIAKDPEAYTDVLEYFCRLVTAEDFMEGY